MIQSEITLSLPQRLVTLSAPLVMGIINCTNASFYQSITHISDVLKKVDEMVQAGAAIIDVGAVATNPGVNMSVDIPTADKECDAIVPIVEAVAKNFDVFISVDTSQATVMKSAVAAGAHIINDQRALREPNALETVLNLKVPVCLMHHFNPARKPNSCTHQVLLSQIKHELKADVERCLSAGMTRDRLIIDPGFGGGNFGKSTDENFYLLSHLSEFLDLELPILVGLSRKSLFGDLLKLSVGNRLNASVAGAVVAAMKGAAIIRVHDVKETVEAMTVVKKIKSYC